VSTKHATDIVVNGRPQSVAEGQTLLSLLGQLQFDPARIAVELDRRIIKQPLWAETVLHPGSQVEVVQFVGGG
jgi:thiamine biosynthesis protein ThiS